MVKPKPFSRPSIDLTSHHREWRYLHPSDVRSGQTIAGVGVIKEVHQGTGRCVVVNLLGISHSLPYERPVLTLVDREEK